MAFRCIYLFHILVLVPLVFASPFTQDSDDSYNQASNEESYVNNPLAEMDDSKPSFGLDLDAPEEGWPVWSNDMATSDSTEKDLIDDWPEKRARTSAFYPMRGKRFGFKFYTPYRFSRTYRRYKPRARPRKFNMFVATRGKRLYDNPQYADLYRDLSEHLANSDVSELVKRRLGFTAMRGKRSVKI